MTVTGYSPDYIFIDEASFGGSKRLIICQTAGMQMWLGIQCMRRIRRAESGSEYIEARIRPSSEIETFSGEVNPACRCRDCRWHRIFRKKA